MIKIIPFAIILALHGCSKIDYVPDNPFRGIPTKVLMHRGNGNNSDYEHNTLPAAIYGMSVLDGSEVDIQISMDGTLWLDHDNEVTDCDGNIIGCFHTMTDSEIESNNSCHGNVRYYTLESVLQIMAADYPDKYISLDIKGQYCNIKFTRDDMKRMADEVFRLVLKYSLEGHVFAESSSIEFLTEISEENAPVGQALIALDDLDQGLTDAYKVKARAISFDYYGGEVLTKESVDLVHKKGFGIFVWVINDPDEIPKAWAMKPDVIQTDNPDFKNYIPR